MSQTKPLSRASQQNNISLEMAIATILDASIEEITEALKQIPPEKKQRIALAWFLTSDLEELGNLDYS